MQKEINITLTNGAIKQFPYGTTSLEIAQHINARLAKNVLAATINGEIRDATSPIETDAILQLLTWEDNEGKQTFWHSSAHIMAEAIAAIYPGVKFGIGPPIENGFYYDLDFGDQSLDAHHLEVIEEKILFLAKENNAFQRKKVSKEDAIVFFTEKKEAYKLELIEGLEDGTITFYQQGNFIDLCKGPHIPHTGFIKAVKLLNVAGAYWRGNATNKQLTRIYGITFPYKKELDTFLTLREEAKKRNHQQLGKELGIFTFSEKVGLGLPLWLPKGAILREKLAQFLEKAQRKRGYQPVVTPHIGHKDLYITSGHYEKYGDDSFQPIGTTTKDEEYLLKPMNCPHHCEIYNHTPRSYKDLPLRFSEFGTVYRYEQHGALHGLTRTRCFTQDDAHIFCRPDQVKEEFAQVIDLVYYVFGALGFTDYTAQLSLREPGSDKYIGNKRDWDIAEEAIKTVTVQKGMRTICMLGEAAFYGPKLDFMVKDALGRSWQLGTVQLDYQLPARFNLTYVGADGQKHQPVMIHRAPFGSLERFIAILIEHTGGKFPVWLAAEQVVILPLSERHISYAQKIDQLFRQDQIRSRVDERNDKLGRKIRDAEQQKIPYMVVIGEKEVENNTLAVRKQGVGSQETMSVETFIQLIRTSQPF